MSMPVAVQGSQTRREPPVVVQPDEALWQAWVLKGRAQDRRRRAAAIRAVKSISIVVLLFTAIGPWSHGAPYEVAVRFIVAAGALSMMFRAIHNQRYSIAVAFGALALLYNPVAPVFTFSGAWQRSVLGISTIPFAASFGWRARTSSREVSDRGDSCKRKDGVTDAV